MRKDLIERLRSVKWEVTDEIDRMPDDPTQKCVFVDMRPDDFRALIREAADALEAARTMQSALQKMVEEWRRHARDYESSAVYAINDCADELECWLNQYGHRV